MPDTSRIVATLGAGGELGDKLADVITALVRKVGDREVGGLETYQVVSFGRTVNGRRFPARWWPRLAKALETGAFERMSARMIVDVMIDHDSF
ncbi:ABC transporter substrate-binding protein [Bradyrhizobium sp. 1050_B9_N1_2]|uniref:ABC transporter substrate-binding protein n=1 Tax=Bradyrhizobium sp. 1050_B9_N1_2 TaxID=3238688 RepID=UPI003EDBC1F1